MDGVGGQRHAPGALPLGKISDTYCAGVWVGPRTYPDGRGKSRPHRYMIPGPSSLQRVAIRISHLGPVNSCEHSNKSSGSANDGEFLE